MRLTFTDIRTKAPLPLIEQRIAEFVGWERGSFNAILCTFADEKQYVCVEYPTDLTESEAFDAIKSNLDRINEPTYKK